MSLPTPSLTSAGLVSPLRQVNEPHTPRTTKLASSWQQLSTNPTLFTGQSATTVARFFRELFCLRVQPEVLRDALETLSVEEMLGPYKNNMTQVFTNAVRTLKEAKLDDIRRSNVVETLIPFLRDVLSRRYTNFSFEVMTLLTGSLERSDHVFTDLVSAIDHTLQATTYPTELRHRTLQLALILVCSVNQGSINAYFLRRDLFSTLTKFISDPATSPFAYESTLLLGVLAQFRKSESRNPYLVRIEDFVDEGVMKRIIEVVTSTCVQSREAYTSLADDAPPSFAASLSSLVFSLRIVDLFSSGLSLSLPAAPAPSAATLAKRKGKERALSVGADDAESHTDAETQETTTKADVVTGAEKKEESAFKGMPPEMLVILLPFYDLLNSNKSFGTLVFHASDDGPSLLPPALISLSSYVLCHAAVSARARAYARLCLILLTILVEEGDEGRLSVEDVEVRLCRQRLPMLPQHGGNRRPALAAMLDSALIFLRHNLHKRLDAESYIVCLKLVQRIMQQLKTERVRLEYDWVAVWRAILSLSAFVVSKAEELRVISTAIDDLVSQIFIVLSYAAYWGESFFPTLKSSVLLHYELLHADAVLNSLADLLASSSSSSAPPTPTPHGLSARDTPLRNAFSLSPRHPHSLPDAAGTGVRSKECVSNVRASIAYFSTKVDELRAARGDDGVDADEIMRVIENQLAGLELAEALAMENMRRYSEGMGGHDAYFRVLSGVACADALALLPAV